MRVFIEPDDSAEKRMMARALEVNGLAVLVENEQIADVQTRFRLALTRLMRDMVFKHKYDHAWVMEVVNQHADEFEVHFNCPQDYVNYITQNLGMVDVIVSSDSLRKEESRRSGRFPNWQFSGGLSTVEIQRRINVAKRFLNLFRLGFNL